MGGKWSRQERFYFCRLHWDSGRRDGAEGTGVASTTEGGVTGSWGENQKRGGLFSPLSKDAASLPCCVHQITDAAGHSPPPSQISTKDLTMPFGMDVLKALCRYLLHYGTDTAGNIRYCQAMTSRPSSRLPGWGHLFPITGSTGAQPRFQPTWRISSLHGLLAWGLRIANDAAFPFSSLEPEGMLAKLNVRNGAKGSLFFLDLVEFLQSFICNFWTQTI